MAVPAPPNAALAFGRPQKLFAFKAPGPVATSARFYDVARDGRFLATVDVGARRAGFPPVIGSLNATADLRRAQSR